MHARTNGREYRRVRTSAVWMETCGVRVDTNESGHKQGTHTDKELRRVHTQSKAGVCNRGWVPHKQRRTIPNKGGDCKNGGGR